MDFQNLDAEKAMVREFRLACGQDADIVRAMTLVAEEGKEVLAAATTLRADRTVANMEAFLKEVADFFYVMIGSLEQGDEIGVEAGQKALEAQPMLVIETGVLINIVEGLVADAYDIFLSDALIMEAFKRVHASNLSKLLPDGTVLKREDGKVLKGPNYAPPKLTDLAEKAMADWDSYREGAAALRELMSAIG